MTRHTIPTLCQSALCALLLLLPGQVGALEAPAPLEALEPADREALETIATHEETLHEAVLEASLHVDVLVDAGLLKVTHTRRARAIDERFYGRVARTYLFPHDGDEVPFLQDFIDEFDHGAWGAHDESGKIGMATLRTARIQAARAAEYQQRLNDLALEFVDEPRGGDTEYGLYVVLFPQRRGEEPT